MKKSLSLLLAAILLLGGLAGCGPTGEGGESSSGTPSGTSATSLFQPEASSTFRIDPKVDPPLSKGLDGWLALPDFLDDDQLLLYQRAATIWGMFRGDYSFVFDNMEPSDGEYVSINSENYPYVKTIGKYSKIEDFMALLQSVFTPLYSQYLLWEVPGSFRVIDGVLYVRNGGKGGNPSYSQPDTFELLNKTDELVQFYLVCHYQDGTDGPAWTEKFPIEMDRTASGWRVSRFAAGNINGTEWQTCQDAIHGEPGWIK